MKAFKIIGKTAIMVFVAIIAASCSEEATDAYNSDSDFSESDILGFWKHEESGVVISIAAGFGVLREAGNVYPQSAVGGTVLTEVVHLGGGYWEALHWNYDETNGWRSTHTIGIAMQEDKQSFLIGSQPYVRQE